MDKWLEAAFGIEIPEHGFARIACPACEKMIWAGKCRGGASSARSKPTAGPAEQLHVYGRRWASAAIIARLAAEDLLQPGAAPFSSLQLLKMEETTAWKDSNAINAAILRASKRYHRA